MPTRAVAGSAALLFWFLAAPLLAHKDDYLADTFVFVTLGARELELEYWLDAQDAPRGLLHTAGAEYGWTNHLMSDVSLRWLQRSGGPLSFQEGFVEVRYRFGEEGIRALDTAASAEYEIRREPETGTRHELLEPRLVLSRDFAGWNATLNLFYAFVLDERRRSAFEGAAGVRSPSFGRWSGGLELRREIALENETLVIPQLWYRFSPETYLKMGAGKNLAGERESFVRIAFEIEL